MGLWDQRKLIHLAILKLLVPDVGSDCLLVPAHRRDEISTRPELVPVKCFAFRSIFCSIQIELLPLIKPITSATAFLRYFGMKTHMIFAIPCGMVQVMLLRHEDLLVGLAVPLGDPSQLLTLMLNSR